MRGKYSESRAHPVPTPRLPRSLNLALATGSHTRRQISRISTQKNSTIYTDNKYRCLEQWNTEGEEEEEECMTRSHTNTTILFT